MFFIYQESITITTSSAATTTTATVTFPITYIYICSVCSLKLPNKFKQPPFHNNLQLCSTWFFFDSKNSFLNLKRIVFFIFLYSYRTTRTVSEMRTKWISDYRDTALQILATLNWKRFGEEHWSIIYLTFATKLSKLDPKLFIKYVLILYKQDQLF